MRKKTSNILAIIPAYNEEANIVSTIEDLRSNAPFVDYVIINDGSTDSTENICKECDYSYLSHATNLGLAGAFQTGMKYANLHEYEYAVQFDADGQHSATYIRDLIEKAQRDDCNIVIGSRFVEKRRHITSARLLGSKLITFLLRLTTGKRISDPTSGMRLFDSTMIPLFAEELDYGPEPDTLALVMRKGAKVGEVQVEMRERAAGDSYLNLTKSVSYMLRICMSILFIQWFRKK